MSDGQAAAANLIEVFSGPMCTYCDAAKKILTESELPFIELSIDQADHLEELKRRLPRGTAIPQIFVDGEHIGSTEDLEARSRDGRAPFHQAT